MFACLDAKGEDYVVEVDLPRVNKRDIDLSLHEGIIHVLAEREDLAFHGRLHFPIRVNPKKAEARFSNGLLGVEVSLIEKRSSPLKIEVK